MAGSWNRDTCCGCRKPSYHHQDVFYYQVVFRIEFHVKSGGCGGVALWCLVLYGLKRLAKGLIDPKLLFVGPKIGEGAHAKVYEGKYKNKIGATKLVNKGDTPEEIAKTKGRFAREVAMLSKVQHNSLVKFIGACKDPVMVIVTKLLTGGTLRKYLVNTRPNELYTHVPIGFALDIARVMGCLHSHGIINQDLKPENLLLTADHISVILADFGLAREESLTEMMTAETGTYRWMAPEIISYCG
ncbi:putative dual-specificity kinase TKL-Pl-4 family [Helianthus anomalus]